MAFLHRLKEGEANLWVALGAVVVGLLHGGSGFVNGDAAVYWFQAEQGDFTQRTVHLGYLVVVWLAAVGVGGEPVLLDAVSAVAVGVAVWRVSVDRPLWTAVAAAVLVMPIGAFAEVDPLWIALLTVAMTTASPWRDVWTALAISVSPTALLALPWLCVRNRSLRSLWVGGLTSVGLVVFSQGDWLWGPRGVWTSPAFRVERSLQEWVGTLWWLVLLATLSGGQFRAIVALIPLLLAPADVPGAVFVGFALLSTIPSAPFSVRRHGVQTGVLLVLLVGSVWSLGERTRQNRADNQWLSGVAAEVATDQRLVAPWTYGVRVSLLVTGEPYGLCWQNHDQILDVQRCVCDDDALEEVKLLAAGVAPQRGPATRPEGCTPGGR